MLDAVHLRHHVSYDAHTKKMAGYVDFGMGTDSETIAKEALVLMVVGLKGRWKAPVAYYLTAGVTAVFQQQLVLATLAKLFEVGLTVHTITMDGHATNVSMCKALGCQLDPSRPLQPYFSMPETGETVQVIFDACHMVNLGRNTLHEYRILVSLKGIIHWDLLTKLHTLQDSIGPRLANKVGKNHILYGNQKMKVSFRF